MYLRRRPTPDNGRHAAATCRTILPRLRGPFPRVSHAPCVPPPAAEWFQRTRSAHARRTCQTRQIGRIDVNDEEHGAHSMLPRKLDARLRYRRYEDAARLRQLKQLSLRCPADRIDHGVRAGRNQRGAISAGQPPRLRPRRAQRRHRLRRHLRSRAGRSVVPAARRSPRRCQHHH